MSDVVKFELTFKSTLELTCLAPVSNFEGREKVDYVGVHSVCRLSNSRIPEQMHSAQFSDIQILLYYKVELQNLNFNLLCLYHF